jgi:hypothetical protein
MTDKKLRELLQRAINRSLGVVSVDDVLERVQAGRLALWFAENSVAVSELNRLPQKTVVNVVLAAGELEELRGVMRDIEAYAQSVDAALVTIVGRRGWGRVLGYVETASLMSKPVGM